MILRKKISHGKTFFCLFYPFHEWKQNSETWRHCPCTTFVHLFWSHKHRRENNLDQTEKNWMFFAPHLSLIICVTVQCLPSLVFAHSSCLSFHSVTSLFTHSSAFSCYLPFSRADVGNWEQGKRKAGKVKWLEGNELQQDWWGKVEKLMVEEEDGKKMHENGAKTTLRPILRQLAYSNI